MSDHTEMELMVMKDDFLGLGNGAEITAASGEIPTKLEEENPKTPQEQLLAYAKEMEELDKEYEELKAKSKKCSDRYDTLRLKLVPDLMSENDIRTTTFDSMGKRLQLAGDMYVSSLAENKEDLFEYLRNNDSESLIQETVNSSTLKAWVKERIENGKDLPHRMIKNDKGEDVREELVKVTPFMRASLVKAAGKKKAKGIDTEKSDVVQ